MNVRDEPVAVSNAITVAIPVVVSALIALGVIDWDTDTAARVTAGLLALVYVAVAALAAWRARTAVTPLSRPRDDYGRPLVAIPRGDEQS